MSARQRTANSRKGRKVFDGFLHFFSRLVPETDKTAEQLQTTNTQIARNTADRSKTKQHHRAVFLPIISTVSFQYSGSRNCSASAGFSVHQRLPECSFTSSYASSTTSLFSQSGTEQITWEAPILRACYWIIQCAGYRATVPRLDRSRKDQGEPATEQVLISCLCAEWSLSMVSACPAITLASMRGDRLIWASFRKSHITFFSSAVLQRGHF